MVYEIEHCPEILMEAVSETGTGSPDRKLCMILDGVCCPPIARPSYPSEESRKSPMMSPEDIEI